MIKNEGNFNEAFNRHIFRFAIFNRMFDNEILSKGRL